MKITTGIIYLALLFVLSGCKTTSIEAGTDDPRIIIVDSERNSDLVETEGFWQSSGGAGNYEWSTLWAYKGKGECKLIWKPKLPEDGKYIVSIRYGSTPKNDHASNCPITIVYDGGREDRRIDQKKSADEWMILGTYSFKAGRSGCVEISNNANGNVVADAVKFEMIQ